MTTDDGRNSAERWAQAAEMARMLHDEEPWYNFARRRQLKQAEAYAMARFQELMED